jgi:beta-glucosidase
MSELLPYQDAARPVEARVRDLLSRMTLEEKIGQLHQAFARIENLEACNAQHVGATLGAQDTLGETFQQALGRASRLGIPVLLGGDAIHGHGYAPGATIFPIQLGMACTWHPELVQNIARVTAREMVVTGLRWTFSPVLCLARDLRWGRVCETFGEDPFLIGELGAAMVRGYQGDDLAMPDAVLACAKHYAGYGETLGAWDASEAALTRRVLRQFFLAPFQRVVSAGVATVMAGYQAIDGTPCSANRWLLTEVLREEMGFAGFVVSDFDNLGNMVTKQFIAQSGKEAAVRAITAGSDMAMATPAFFDAAREAVADGAVGEEAIDACCRRVLRAKFQLGLFDSDWRYDATRAADVLGCPAHRDVARQAATEAVVLLKNRGVLPLAATVHKIAVLGPHADHVDMQLGDWTFLTRALSEAPEYRDKVHPRAAQVSVLDGLCAALGSQADIRYCRGADAVDEAYDDIEAAARLAREADVAIVVVGDQLELFGEAKSRASLQLRGKQQALLEAVKATGTPLIVVLMSSKPLVIPWVAEHADAVLCTFCPGSRGGEGLAAILTGQANPSGKLPVSFPCADGQTPTYYYAPPGWHGPRYVDLPPAAQGPLYPFGFGLSYTTYAYSDLMVLAPVLQQGDSLDVSVRVTNTGERDGVEIVQLYLRDVVASVTRPDKLLQAFARAPLAAGESRTVTLTVPYAQLALITADAQWAVEPGEFEVLVGPSSDEARLMSALFRVAEPVARIG